MKQPLYAAYLSLALAGCAVPGLQPAPGSIAVAGTVTATLRLDVRDAGRALLAALEPWRKADVRRVKLALYKGDELVTQVTIAQADLDKAVVFQALERNTAYRVEARAWSDEAETSPIDNFVNDAETCTTAFTTGEAAAHDVGAIALRLRDKTFARAGLTTGFVVSPGQLGIAAREAIVTGNVGDDDCPCE